MKIYENTMEADAEIPTREEAVRTYEAPPAEPLRLEVESFLDSCWTDDTPRASGGVGVAAVEILETAERSASSGQAVDVDLSELPN